MILQDFKNSAGSTTYSRSSMANFDRRIGIWPDRHMKVEIFNANDNRKRTLGQIRAARKLPPETSKMWGLRLFPTPMGCDRPIGRKFVPCHNP